eukprot:6237545-Pyramimonas_sp.AAC.1
MESDREVFLSDYEFEVELDTVIGKCHVWHQLFDSGADEDLVCTKFLDHIGKTTHPLRAPTSRKELRAVLPLLRRLALIANPGCVASFGRILRTALYKFCRDKETLKRPHHPRFHVNCNLYTYLGAISDPLLNTATCTNGVIEVMVEDVQQLEYLLGEGWDEVVVQPRIEGRDVAFYELAFPVSLGFRVEQGDHMFLKMDSLKKSNNLRVEQWNTRYVARIVDGEEDDDGLDD